MVKEENEGVMADRVRKILKGKNKGGSFCSILPLWCAISTIFSIKPQNLQYGFHYSPIHCGAGCFLLCFILLCSELQQSVSTVSEWP